MKRTAYFLFLALCLTLTACGHKEPAPGVSSSTPEASASQSGSASFSPASEPEPAKSDVSQPEFPAPLTAEEKAAARQAALDYYQGTVFEVDSLTEIEPRQGEIAFQVSCSKEGIKADPDRTIWLERQDGIWTVVNEGY